MPFLNPAFSFFDLPKKMPISKMFDLFLLKEKFTFFSVTEFTERRLPAAHMSLRQGTVTVRISQITYSAARPLRLKSNYEIMKCNNLRF